MKRIALCGAALGALFAAAAAQAQGQSQAPSWSVPAENQRCPSKWGAGDERGSGNLMKPQVVLDAVKLIKTGEVIDLAHVLGGTMPFFGTRRFDIHLKRTFMNTGSNERGSNEEMVLAEIGQVGTQFDGFAHQSYRNQHYNCFKTEEITGRGGFTKLGVDNAPAFITRGVLIDVAGRPSQVSLQTSSGHPALDESAVSAVRAAQFRPYSEGGITQAVWVLVPINFVLR